MKGFSDIIPISGSSAGGDALKNNLRMAWYIHTWTKRIHRGRISALMLRAFSLRNSCNIPFVIQRDVLVCEQSDRRHVSLQTYIAAVGPCFLWRMQTLNAFVRLHSILILHRTVLTLRGSDFTLKCIEVFVVYLNIIERSSQLRVLLESQGRP